MILPSSQIADLIRTTGMIHPTSPEQLDNIEGNTYDVTLGNIYKIYTSNMPNISSPYQKHENSASSLTSLIGRERRFIPKPQAIPWSKRGRNQLDITVRQGESVILETIETVTPPAALMIQVIRRTSLFRAGAIVDVGWVKPGFSGKLFFLLYLTPDAPRLKLEYGAGIAGLLFHQVAPGDYVPYDGIWHGDKTGTDGVERAQ